MILELGNEDLLHSTSILYLEVIGTLFCTFAFRDLSYSVARIGWFDCLAGHKQPANNDEQSLKNADPQSHGQMGAARVSIRRSTRVHPRIPTPQMHYLKL